VLRPCRAERLPPAGGYRQRLRNYNNVQYVGDIEVGGQQVGALFDTGSDDLVLRSTECRRCAHHTEAYDHKSSETYKLHGVIHKITYGAGSCTVLRGWDSVTVGSLHTPKQEIWEVMSHSMPLWDQSSYSALVGMSPTAGSGYVHGDTLLVSLGVDAFSICFGRSNGSDGYLTWGEPGATGHPAAKLLGKDTWVTGLSNITLTGGSTVRLCGSSPCSVLIDSGHSLIEGPKDQILELSKHIWINNDCSNLNELPTLRFEVDGQLLELPPQAYVVRLGGSQAEAKRVWPFLPTGGPMKKFMPNSCQPAFMIGRPAKTGPPQWVIGMPFFRYYKTTFDRKALTMSFAEAGPSCEAAAPTGTVSLATRRAELASLAPVEVNLRDIAALVERRYGPPASARGRALPSSSGDLESCAVACALPLVSGV